MTEIEERVALAIFRDGQKYLPGAEPMLYGVIQHWLLMNKNHLARVAIEVLRDSPGLKE